MFLILLGPPGAGKGTQAALLAERWGLAHVSSGDLFREVIRSKGALGRKVKAYYDRGELVPDELTIDMFLERLGRPDCARGAVLDGFPRNRPQAEALDRALAARGLAIDRAASIRVSEEEVLARLGGRWSCRSCGAIYHERNQPPRRPGVCDSCGGELYQRSDDQPETVRHRLAIYLEQTASIVEYYRSQGKLVEVDGGGDPEAVSRALAQALAPARVARQTRAPAGR